MPQEPKLDYAVRRRVLHGELAKVFKANFDSLTFTNKEVADIVAPEVSLAEDPTDI